MGPQGKRFEFILVDLYSEMGITGQLKEGAGPHPDRR